MLYKEASKRIKDIIKHNSFTEDESEALKLALSAVKRNIAKKPMGYHHIWKGVVAECPNCGYEVEENYCPNCGQRVGYKQ